MKRVLTLDKGNHSLKAALFDSGEIVKRWDGGSQDNGATIAEILGSCVPEGAALSSVVPGWALAVRRELASLGVENVLDAGAGARLPFDLLVDRPECIGPDRLCAACGAVAMGLSEAVIVDAGTAVTVDLLVSEGFLGGAIFPGLDLLLEILHTGTAALPRVEGDVKGVVPPGRDTKEAIIAGTVWGLIGAVRELVEKSRESLTPQAEVLVTGGGAGLVASHIEGAVRIEPDLVFLGLLYIFNMNFFDNPGS